MLYQAILLKGKGGKGIHGGEVVMAGGRYDGLVKMFAQQQQQQQQQQQEGIVVDESVSSVGAVGVNIAVEKIVAGIYYLTIIFLKR